MEFFTATQIAGTAIKAAKGTFDVGVALREFYKDSKDIDTTMEAFASEVKTLGTACSLIGKRLEGIIKEQDAEIAKRAPSDDMEDSLWDCLEEQVAACEKTVLQLKDAVSSSGRDYSKNVTLISQATRQFKLNMKAPQIIELRNRIQSHTASLQLMLLVVATAVAYVMPQQADQRLRTQIAELSSKMDEVKVAQAGKSPESTARENQVIDVTNKVIDRAETLYAKSVAGGSEFIPHEMRRTSTMYAWMRDLSTIDEMRERNEKSLDAVLDPFENDIRTAPSTRTVENSAVGNSVVESVIGGLKPGQDQVITDWLQHTEAIEEHASESSESTPFTESSSVLSAAHQRQGGYTNTSMSTSSSFWAANEREDDAEPEEDGYDDDGILLEAAQHAMNEGKEAFERQDYSEACPMLEESLKIVLELPVNKQSICDTSEIRHMLGVCAFHLKEPAEAQPVLLQVLEHALKPKAQTNARRLHTCDTGHLLSQTCLRLGRLAEARQYCKNALQGRQRLLGKNHEACFESLALLSRIEELDGNSYRGKAYSLSIPQERRAEFLKLYEALGGPQDQLKRSTSLNTVDVALSPGSSGLISRVRTEPEPSTAGTRFLGAEPTQVPTPKRRSGSGERMRTLQLPSTQSRDTAANDPPKMSEDESTATVVNPELPNSAVKALAVRKPVSLSKSSLPTTRPATTTPELGSTSPPLSGSLPGTRSLSEVGSGEAKRIEASTASIVSEPPSFAESGPVKQPTSTESSSFASQASQYKNKALRKLVLSAGYTPPGPASLSLRRTWASHYEFDGDTDLKEALINGNSNMAAFYAEKHSKRSHWLKNRSSSTVPELHCAALFGEAEVVRILLRRGVKPSYGSCDDWLAIEFAAIGGYKNVVQDLLRAGSAVGSSIWFATVLERLDVLDFLLALYDGPRPPDKAVHAACFSDSPLLLEAVTDEQNGLIEYKRISVWSLLRLRQSVTTQIVAKKKGSPTYKTGKISELWSLNPLFELQPLAVAALCGCTSTLAYLIHQEVPLYNMYTVSGKPFTAWELACMRGNSDVLRLFLESPVFSKSSATKLAIADRFGIPLFLADLNQHQHCRDVLFRTRCSYEAAVEHLINPVDPLSSARWKYVDDPVFFETLGSKILRAMARDNLLCEVHNPDLRKDYWKSFNPVTMGFVRLLSQDPALVAAAKARNPCAVKWLLEHGITVDLVDSDGQGALLVATLLNDYKMAEMLIRCGAKKSIQSSSGLSPVSEANKIKLIKWRVLFDERHYDLSRTPRQFRGSLSDEEAFSIAHLVSLGFSKPQAITALNKCHWDLSTVADFLSERDQSAELPKFDLNIIWSCPQAREAAVSGEVNLPPEVGIPVFGKELSALTLDENYPVPRIIVNCLEIIEWKAQTDYNYFSADLETSTPISLELIAKIDGLAPGAVELDRTGEDELADTRVIINTLKELLLSLPTPIVPLALQSPLLDACDHPDSEMKLTAVQSVLDSLTNVQCTTLRTLTVHFWRMQAHSDEDCLGDVSRFAVPLLLGQSASVDVFENAISAIIVNVHEIFFEAP